MITGLGRCVSAVENRLARSLLLISEQVLDSGESVGGVVARGVAVTTGAVV